MLKPIFLTLSLIVTQVSAKEIYIAPPSEDITTFGMTMPELVDFYAEKHGVDKTIMNKVVKCESSYNPNAVNWSDSHKLSKGSHGIAQFSQQTFEQYAKQMGKEYTDPYNPREALDVMGYMISKGLGRHWTCFRALQGV